MAASNKRNSRGITSTLGRFSSDRDEESDEESSVASEVTHNRLKRVPVLPSVSSTASIRHIKEKLAAFSRSRRHTSLVPAARYSRPHPLQSNGDIETRLPAEVQQKKSSPAPSRHEKHGPRMLSQEVQEGRTTPATISQTMPDNTMPGRDISGTVEPETRWYGIGTPSSTIFVPEKGFSKDWTEEDEAGKDMELGPDEIKRITLHWAKLREHRDALKSSFRNIRRERVNLRDSRQRKDAAYRSLRLAIEEILPRHPLLDKLFKEAQRADLTYQEAELNFDDLVDDLEEGETQLELEERRFYTIVAESDISTESDISRPASRETLRGIRGHRSEDTHPRFEELRDAFQELQLAKEEQINLTLKRRMVKSKNSEELTEEDRESLKEWDSRDERVNYEIELWTQRAKMLEKECREKNLIPKNTPFHQEGFGFYPVFLDDIHLEEPTISGSASGDHPNKLADPRFSLLLSNPTHLLANPPHTAKRSLLLAISSPASLPQREQFIENAKKEFGIESLLGSSSDDDKRGYINRWLLHKLRQSTLEVELLSTYFRSFLKILDLEQWQRDVLFFWSRDATATGARDADDNFSIPTSDISARASPRTSFHSGRISSNARVMSQPSRRTSNWSGSASSYATRPSTNARRTSIHSD